MVAAVAGSIIKTVASFAPVPYLETSLSILGALYVSIQRVRGIRAQMTALATTIEELLRGLNPKLHGMDHIDESIQNSLQELNGLLMDINETAIKYSERSYLKIFFTPKDIQALINQHQKNIERVSTNFQMHLQMVIHNDIRKFEDARKKDHKELLKEIREIENNKRQFVQAANEAIKDEFPLTESDVKAYFNTVDTSSEDHQLERDIVDKMLRCLNRQSSILVSPQYPGSSSTEWSPQQYTTSHSHAPHYYYSSEPTDEPTGMAEFESQMPVNHPYPPSRPAYSPVEPGSWQYSAPPAPPQPWVPRSFSSVNDSQPYGPPGQGPVPQFPVPHHYRTIG